MEEIYQKIYDIKTCGYMDGTPEPYNKLMKCKKFLNNVKHDDLDDFMNEIGIHQIFNDLLDYFADNKDIIIETNEKIKLRDLENDHKNFLEVCYDADEYISFLLVAKEEGKMSEKQLEWFDSLREKLQSIKDEVDDDKSCLSGTINPAYHIFREIKNLRDEVFCDPKPKPKLSDLLLKIAMLPF